MAGTPDYMAPELWKGGKVSVASDIYALGVILSEMGAERKPAEIGQSSSTVLFQEYPVRKPPRGHGKWNRVVARCLDPEPARRFRTAEEVARALGPSVGERPIGTMPVLVFTLLTLAVLASIWFSIRAQTRRTTLPQPQRLTAAPIENPVFQSSLSPDGKMIAYGDDFGIQLESLSTRESWTLLRAEGSPNADMWWPADWFPDGNHLLVKSAKTTPTGLKLSAWAVSIHSRRAVKLRDDCIAHSVSPDGLRIAFTVGGISAREEIWVMGSQGEAARKVLNSENLGDADSLFSSVRWSPDGQRIAFRKEDHSSDRVRISVESVNLNGGSRLVIAANAELWGDFCWLSDGRILFSLGSLNGSEDMNLWALRTRPQSGTPVGEKQQLTDWTGLSVENLSASKDGVRLSFDKINAQTDVFVGDLNAKGFLKPPRRLTLDDFDDVPSAWANDNTTLFFTTAHPGLFLFQKQNINAVQPEPVLTSHIQMGPVRLTPDGAFLLYIEGAGENRRLMIAPASGGRPQEFDFGNRGVVGNVVCSQKPARNCLAGTLDRPRHKLVLWEIEPPSRDIRRLFAIDCDLRKGRNWMLSPDGTQIATSKNDQDHGEIQIYSLDGAMKRRVRVNGFNQFLSIDWAADGASWFVGTRTATGCSLLKVHQNGRAQVLLNMRGRNMRSFAIPSPNGRRLAILGWTISRNVWMVDQTNR
jgi:eukaryotic-like serine/threonine-protein kinase